MAIRRISFIGFSVLSPDNRSQHEWKPTEWKGWTAEIQGPQLVLEGKGQRIEVPRARCVVYSDAEPVVAEPKGKAK